MKVEKQMEKFIVKYLPDSLVHEESVYALEGKSKEQIFEYFHDGIAKWFKNIEHYNSAHKELLMDSSSKDAAEAYDEAYKKIAFLEINGYKMNLFYGLFAYHGNEKPPIDSIMEASELEIYSYDEWFEMMKPERTENEK